MKRIINQEKLLKYQKQQPFNQVPSVEQWLEYWLNTHIKPTCKYNTYANFYSYIHSHILPIIGDYLIDEITTIELQYYVDYKLEHGRLDGTGGLSLKTVKEHIGVISSALKKAIALQMITYNPVQNIIFPKCNQVEIEILSIEEQKNIDNHIDPIYKSNSLIPLLLGQYAGLRIGEISALRINDIDLNKRLICIDQSLNRIPVHFEDGSIRNKLIYGTTKSNRVRYVPMNDDIYNALSIYFQTMPMHIRQDTTYPLFVNQRQKVMEPQNITYHFQKLLKLLHIEGVHFHCLRHTFATRALELNIDVKSCSKILGHANTQITIDRYTHISHQHLSNEMKKMNHTALLSI